jgi:hypothetical protein
LAGEEPASSELFSLQTIVRFQARQFADLEARFHSLLDIFGRFCEDGASLQVKLGAFQDATQLRFDSGSSESGYGEPEPCAFQE